MVDLQFVEQRTQFRRAAGRVQIVAQLQNGEDVVGHAEPTKNRCFLRQITDAVPGAQMHGLHGDVFIVEHDAAGIGSDQPDYHVEARCLAGAIRAE